MRYYCNECERIYEEDQLDIEENIFGTKYYICPSCKEGDIEVCERCEVCGEYIPPDMVFCETCRENIKTSWENMVNGFSKENRISYGSAEEFISDWVERNVW